jgi:hypothetical protein
MVHVYLYAVVKLLMCDVRELMHDGCDARHVRPGLLGGVPSTLANLADTLKVLQIAHCHK